MITRHWNRMRAHKCRAYCWEPQFYFDVGETGMIIFVLMGEKAAALESHEPWLNVTNITRFVTFLKNKILSIELDCFLQLQAVPLQHTPNLFSLLVK